MSINLNAMCDLHPAYDEIKECVIKYCFDYCTELLNKGFDHDDMAKELGVTKRVIEKWGQEKHHITIDIRRKEKQLSNIQRDLINGSLLGDGHICKTNHFFVVSHADNQKDYLFWKYEILKNICNKPPSYIEPKLHSFGDDKQYMCKGQYRIGTCIVNALVPIREMPKSDIISQLNEFGLAIHFLDDGSRSKEGTWELCYASLTESEKELYCRVIKDKFNIEPRIRKDERYIGFGKIDSAIIDEIILRNIPNDLDVIKYKILNRR